MKPYYRGKIHHRKYVILLEFNFNWIVICFGYIMYLCWKRIWSETYFYWYNIWVTIYWWHYNILNNILLNFIWSLFSWKRFELSYLMRFWRNTFLTKYGSSLILFRQNMFQFNMISVLIFKRRYMVSSKYFSN